MIQSDKTYLIEFAKRYSGWIVAVILLITMITCNRQSDHSGVVALREKENLALKHKIDSLFEANKSKDKLIAESEKKVAKTQIAIHDLNKQIIAERQKGAKQIAKIQSYGLVEWKTFYQERSGFGDKDISLQVNTLNFTKSPLVKVASDLINGDIAKAEVRLKNNVIAEKDTIISEKDKIIDSERGKVVNLLSINDTHKAIEENLNQNVADLKKDLKKANRVRIKPIIISAVLGGIAGAYLGK